jgi:hypothetical protein
MLQVLSDLQAWTDPPRPISYSTQKIVLQNRITEYSADIIMFAEL